MESKTCNRLLATLPTEDYRRLTPYFECVSLTLGETVYRADSKIRFVYFPETSVISMLANLESGHTSEVGLIGPEGMVGVPIILGGARTHDQAIVQVAGTAIRVHSARFKTLLSIGSPFYLHILRYTCTFLEQVSQSVVCSQHHSVDQRLARWLLTMRDYTKSDSVVVTHELIAGMIGSRRASVSDALTRLRNAGTICSGRGTITIRNAEKLKALACECYEVMRTALSKLDLEQCSGQR